MATVPECPPELHQRMTAPITVTEINKIIENLKKENEYLYFKVMKFESLKSEALKMKNILKQTEDSLEESINVIFSLMIGFALNQGADILTAKVQNLYRVLKENHIALLSCMSKSSLGESDIKMECNADPDSKIEILDFHGTLDVV